MENVLGTDPFNHTPLKEQLGKNIYDCECGGSGFIRNMPIWYNSHGGLISID